MLVPVEGYHYRGDARVRRPSCQGHAATMEATDEERAGLKRFWAGKQRLSDVHGTNCCSVYVAQRVAAKKL